MEEKQKKKLITSIIIILTGILVLLTLFINFAIVNPIYSNKKIEMPRIMSEFAVQKNYVSYFIQEIGGDKIHKKSLSGELPRINVIIKDIGKFFTTEIDENIETYEGIIGNSDVAIEINRKDFFEVMKAKDKNKVMMQKFKEGKSKIELKKSRGELASKGYKKMLKNFEESIEIFDLISEKMYTKDVMLVSILFLICAITIMYVAYY